MSAIPTIQTLCIIRGNWTIPPKFGWISFMIFFQKNFQSWVRNIIHAYLLFIYLSNNRPSWIKNNKLLHFIPTDLWLERSSFLPKIYFIIFISLIYLFIFQVLLNLLILIFHSMNLWFQKLTSMIPSKAPIFSFWPCLAF